MPIKPAKMAYKLLLLLILKKKLLKLYRLKFKSWSNFHSIARY